jgi:flavin reductase (DIM6/NTAB) family NADH-FMN oxidoreductase RutF
MSKSHYTNQGIKENGTFSVNMPSSKLMKETDYCGLVSGKKEDKAKLFKVFYGTLKTAPMIEECPINMECELTHTFDSESHDIFVGKVVETYVDDQVLDSGVVNFAKVDPLLFAMNDRGYWSLGRRLGSAWSVGMELKRKKQTQ